jgi:hypothetical protein
VASPNSEPIIERVYKPDPKAQARALAVLVRRLMELEKEEDCGPESPSLS